MNSENVKKNVPFLKHDCNLLHSYQLVKSDKQVLNLHKDQLYSTHHSTIHDYSLVPSNTFAEYPFTGSSWYTDFNLPKIPLCYNSFVLRFKLTSNNPTDTFYYLPIPMLLERVVLLKNSTVLNEVNSEDIFLYNLHKISNKYDTSHSDFDYLCQLGLTNEIDNTKNFVSPFFLNNRVNTPNIYNCEIPLCLTNSNFLSSAIKNDLVIRFYWRGNIVISDYGSNSNIKMSDLKLMLRMKETSFNLLKEPKLNHLFTKKILTKINIPKLDANNYYNINITGFNSVASFAFVFIREQDQNINFTNYRYYHEYKYAIDEVSLVDNTGKNILQSDIILDRDYNRYLMSENLHQFASVIHKLCPEYNDGHLFLIPFNYNGNLSYNSGFNGGYSFQSNVDYKIKFKSLNSSNNSVILNILWFSPTILDLENGNLREILSSN